jgi:imidazolonepropionase-like amidohydrolase
MRTPFTVLPLLIALLWPAWPESTSSTLVLTNVNVVDTRTGRLEPKVTVVVRDGRIKAVAKVGLIEASRRLKVINATGKYLIPGLWDMHVHSAGGPAAAWDENVIYPLYIANGVTAVRDMGGNLDLLEQRKNLIQKGELVGPHMFFAGPFLDGGDPPPNKPDPQVISVNTPSQGRQAVDTLKKAGVDFVKVLSKVPHDAYLAVAEEAARLKMKLVGHVPESVSAAEASASGQRSIEHLSGILLACSTEEAELRHRRLEALAKEDSASASAVNKQTLATYSSDKARGLFIELADNNTYQVPTLVWWNANARVDDPELAKDYRLRYVPSWARTEWDPANLQKQNPSDQLDYLKSLANRYIDLVRAMHRVGVPFLAGTDGPDPYVFPGFSLHDELEMLTKAGFSNFEALQTATFYPALFMTKLDQYGVVEPGRAADMVLLNQNPLEDIRNTRAIAAVVVDGKYFSREDLDGLLAKVEAAANRQQTAVAGN